MRTIGVIGGMSWVSTLDYYRRLNRAAQARLGGHASAEILLRSVDFAPIEAMQRADDWEAAGRRLNAAARDLERGGAGLVLLATNTMHKVADAMMAGVGLPFLHIADPTADAIRAAGLRRIGLLATRYTMEREFYRGRLEAAGLEVLVPEADDRALVHRVIFEELVHDRIEPVSRRAYLDVVARLRTRGAEGIILGCTEIGLLLRPDDVPGLPLFDTTALHCEAAVGWSLAEG